MLATLGGILSIYLGWKLYREGIVSAVESEVRHGDKWKFAMKALGPGVFFALFGMWILVTVIGKEVSTESRGEPVEVEEVSGDAAPAAKKVSFWLGLIPQAQAQTVKRARLCAYYTRTVNYDGDVIAKQDFQTAIDDAVSALRAGEFDPAAQNKANHAIAILARLSSANGGAVQ